MGPLFRTWRPHRDQVLLLPGEAVSILVFTRVTFGSAAISANLTPPLINVIQFQQMDRLFLDKPFFPSVLLGLNRTRFDPRPLRAALRPKSVRFAKRVRVLPQRRADVSSAANQPRSSHSHWTLGLTACPVLLSRTRREDRHEPDQLRAFDETG